MSELILKPMESEEEIRGKAYVHWKSWQETYPGLVDADYLQRLTLETCEERAFRWTSDTWIAKMDGQVVGFACCGASREQSGAGGDLRALRAGSLPEAKHRLAAAAALSEGAGRL